MLGPGRQGGEDGVNAHGVSVAAPGLGGAVCASLTGVFVCLSPASPQEVSELELTVHMSRPNGTRPRGVLLVLGIDKYVIVSLKTPGIPLHLAFVSVTSDRRLRHQPWEGPAWRILWGPAWRREPKSQQGLGESPSLDLGCKWMDYPGQLHPLA